MIKLSIIKFLNDATAHYNDHIQDGEAFRMDQAGALLKYKKDGIWTDELDDLAWIRIDASFGCYDEDELAFDYDEAQNYKKEFVDAFIVDYFDTIVSVYYNN